MAKSVFKSSGILSTQASSAVGPNNSAIVPKTSGAEDEELEATAETITIEAGDGINNILKERSLSSVRPEIILQADFLSATDGENITPAGRFLNMQTTLRNLAAENVATIISALSQDDATKDSINTLVDSVSSSASESESILSTLSDIYDQITAMKLALDPLDEQSKIVSTIEQIRNANGGQLPPIGQFSEIDEIMACQLGFSHENVDLMSNTKVLGQILRDLRILIDKHSPILVTGYNDSRYNDQDPVLINTSPISDDDFGFTLGTLSSEENITQTGDGTFTAFDPTSSSSLSSFTTSLPADEVARIKVLVSAISKELRISVGIHNLIDSTFDEKYTVEDGGLFDRVIGTLGDSIVGDVPSSSSLAELLRLQDSSKNFVLPLEARVVVDSTENRKYIPGSVAFVDSILEGDVKFDTGALSSYSKKVETTVADSSFVIEKMLNFDDEDETSYCSSVLKDVYAAAVKSFGAMAITNADPTTTTAVCAALLNAAYGDVTLRQLLVKYMLGIRTGVYATSSTSDSGETTDGTGGTSIDPGPSDGNTGGFIGGIITLKDPTGDSAGGLFGDDASSDSSGVSNLGAKGTVGLNPTLKVGMNPADASSTAKITTQVTNKEVEGGAVQATLDTSSVTETIESRIRSIYLTSNNSLSEITALSGRTSKLGGATGTTTDLPGVSGNTIVSTSDSLIPVADGMIKTILEDVTSDLLVFKTISDLAYSLVSESSFKCDNNGVTFKTGLYTTTGYTRYSRWSQETIMLVVLEVFSAMCSKFISGSFAQSGSDLAVSVDTSKNSSAINKMDSISTSKSRIESDTTRNLFNSSTTVGLLESIHSSMITEDAIARDIVNLFKGLASVIVAQALAAVDFFNTSAKTNTAASLKDLVSTDRGTLFLDMFTGTQVALAWKAEDELLKATDISLIPKANVMSTNLLSLISALVKDPDFKSPMGDKIKLLAIGLTTGTVEALQNPTFTVGVDTSLEPISSDVITVSVYRRDPSFEDLVFKPLSFTFDASRFADVDFANITGNSIDAVIQSLLVGIRDISPGGIDKSVDINAFKSDTEYADLSSDRVTSMFKNHVLDGVLKVYIRAMTGLDLSETKFVANEDLLNVSISSEASNVLTAVDNASLQTITSLFDTVESQEIVDALLGKDPLFESVSGRKAGSSLSTLLTGTATDLEGETLTEVAASDAASSLTSAEEAFITVQEKTIPELSAFLNSVSTGNETTTPGTVETESASADQLRQLLSSLLFSVEGQRSYVESPKLFERIFVIPVSVDDFEIDIDETSSTDSGQALLSNDAFKSYVTYSEDDVGNTIAKLIPTSTDEDRIVFSEFFVTVALGDNT